MLGLSSAAAPDATLDGLIEACTRRGLSALELREGDGHAIGIGEAAPALAGAVARAAAAGVAIVGYRLRSGAGSEYPGPLAAALGAPVLVGGGAPVEARIDRAVRLSAGGATALVVIAGEAAAGEAESAGRAGVGVAWDADPTLVDVGREVDRLLDRAGPALRYIRLIGGGPEAAMQAGRGIGALMGRLALSGFAGPLVLAPSSRRYRVAWESWLGRRGGWGCGSKVADPEQVRLAVRQETGGGGG